MQDGHRAGVIDVAAGIGVEEDPFGLRDSQRLKFL